MNLKTAYQKPKTPSHNTLRKNQELDSQKHSMMREAEQIYKLKIAKLEEDIEAQQQKQHNEISMI